jgi:hypothetical protein
LALQGVGNGTAATGKQGRLADMLRISMSVEIASNDEVMRVYPGMAIERIRHAISHDRS